MRCTSSRRYRPSVPKAWLTLPPRHMAAAVSPTRQGVLGITRTTRASGPAAASKLWGWLGNNQRGGGQVPRHEASQFHPHFTHSIPTSTLRSALQSKRWCGIRHTGCTAFPPHISSSDGHKVLHDKPRVHPYIIHTYVSSVIPAAMETMVWEALSTGRSSCSTPDTCWGFTATKMTSLLLATCRDRIGPGGKQMS